MTSSPQPIPNRAGEPLMTALEVCEYFQISINTLYKWVDRLYCPMPVKVGKHLRFFPDEIRDWAKTQQLGPDGRPDNPRRPI